ncbi:MAG: hypothetical protein ACJAZ9_001946 [Neolewinella sp.]|jgi:hypothetical protein
MVHPYRQRNLVALANKLDMSFHEEDDYGLEAQLKDFKLFQEGRSKKVARILRKQAGLMDFDASIFDYSFKKFGGSANNNTVYQTVFFIQSANLGLPELWMKPETIAHKLGELLGFGDIDFVRYPKFSGQYRLTGEDEEYIRHHFTDDVLNYFTLNKGLSMEGLGFYMIFYRKGTLIPSVQIEQFYNRGKEIYNLLTDQNAQNSIFGETT